MTWIRVINEWLYNYQEGSPANTEDFRRAYPRFAKGIIWWDSSVSVEAQKYELRALRSQLIEAFDLPADGTPGQCR
jgi:hypothetical protein